MAYTFSNDIVSDLHKDAYGFRPAQRFFDDWNTYSDDEKQECWDTMIKDMEANMEIQKKEEADALIEFRAEIRQVMDLVSCKWNDALRHLLVAEDQEEEIDYFLWGRGLGFEDRNKIHNLYKETV